MVAGCTSSPGLRRLRQPRSESPDRLQGYYAIMPPLANEAEHARYWAAQPKPASRAEWIDLYASALDKVRSRMSLDDAYAAGIEAHKTQAKIHPRLAAAADLILGPL